MESKVWIVAEVNYQDLLHLWGQDVKLSELLQDLKHATILPKGLGPHVRDYVLGITLTPAYQDTDGLKIEE